MLVLIGVPPHLQVPEYLYPSDSVPDYGSILVPNVDNVRSDFLIQTIMKQEGKAVLLTGEQGTAKTVMIRVSVTHTRERRRALWGSVWLRR